MLTRRRAARLIAAGLRQPIPGAMLNIKSDGQLHRFRWVDLASADAGAAQSFYRDLFGWTVRERSIG
jgi:hypothetical protein